MRRSGREFFFQVKCVKMKGSALATVIAAVVVTIAVILIVAYCTTPWWWNRITPSRVERLTRSGGEKGVATVLFFRADWCEHCAKALQALSELDGKEVKGADGNTRVIRFYVIDATTPRQVRALSEWSQKMNVPVIDFIPGIYVLHTGAWHQYNSDPASAQEISDFITSPA